jgi:glycosyltransferase involved in cell wall biosynthesis
MVEAFGQIAAESLSCSTPIVSFDTSGLRDIVTHNHNGLFAEPFSVSSFCEQLLKIIESPKKVRLKMGENGRKHILENFSYTVIKSKYLNVLQDANKLSNIRKK